MDDAVVQSFYTAFEDRYRGSTALICERLSIYEPLARASGGPVLDLGCGRGEWLSLLRQWGIDAEGVDLEPGMVASCQQQGLAVQALDAITALRARPIASLGMVTALHVVEHLPFAVLEELVRESLRVLRPGGFLLMETPNAENLLVGANDFYTDPTHQRPIPANLLRFLPEQIGFQRSNVVRLHELLPAHRLLEAGLLGVLAGVSQDYAVVALADHAPAAEAALAAFLRSVPGVSLQDACAAYDQLHYQQLEQLSTRLEESHRALQKALEDQLHQAWEQARQYAETNLVLQRSASWRLTAPLRLVGRLGRPLARRLVRRDGQGRWVLALRPGRLMRAVTGGDDASRGLPLRMDARDLWQASESCGESK